MFRALELYRKIKSKGVSWFTGIRHKQMKLLDPVLQMEIKCDLTEKTEVG